MEVIGDPKDIVVRGRIIHEIATNITPGAISALLLMADDITEARMITTQMRQGVLTDMAGPTDLIG